MTRTKRQLIGLLGVLVFGCVVVVGAPQLHAQQAAKKAYAFKGMVEKVDDKAKTLTVTNEDIPGWMMAMTMSYSVDKDDVLKQVRAGDEITATVYEGDTKTLYNVKVVRAEKKK